MKFVFCSSHSSVVDDSLEEHKLLNQHSETARLRELAGEEDEGGGDSIESEELQTLEQLRETIKTERGQKVSTIVYVYVPC